MATLPPNECLPVGKPSDRTFTSRASWMRWRPSPSDPASGLWELALVGDPFERGQAATALAAPIESRIEHEMLAQLDLHLPAALPRFLIVRGMTTNLLDLPSYVPDPLQEEVSAAALTYPDPFSYLAPTYPRILAYHALHDVSQMLIDNPLVVPNDFACTGVVSLPAYTSGSGGGHLLLARNFDFEGGQAFSTQKSVTYVIPTEPDSIPFAHIAWPGLSGAVTGINQERLALFINAAATKDFRRIGTPTILLARQVLQTCRTLDEAEALIRQTPVFVSDILVLADGKTGKARVIEKSPAATASYDIFASAVVTNHLTTDRFKDDPVNQQRIREGTTAQRYARARQLLDRLEARVTPTDLVALLRDKKGLGDVDLGLGNRNAIDGLIACHGAVIDATDGMLYVSTSPHVEGDFLAIDVLSILNRLSNAARKSGGTMDGGSTLLSINYLPPIPTIPCDSIIVPNSDGQVPYADYLAFRSGVERAAAALRRFDGVTALAACQSAIELNPNSDEPHTLMAHVYLQQHNLAAAKAAAQQALLRHPAYEKVRAALQRIVDAP